MMSLIIVYINIVFCALNIAAYAVGGHWYNLCIAIICGGVALVNLVLVRLT